MTTQAQSIIQQGITGTQTRTVASQPAAPPAPVTEAMQLTESSPIDLDPKLLDIGIKPQPHLCYLWVMEEAKKDNESHCRVFASNLFTKQATATFTFVRNFTQYSDNIEQQYAIVRQAWDNMVVFSKKLPTLSRWFKTTIQKVHESANRTPELIIYDASGPNIPWEMFHVSQVDRVFVGSKFVTVRWSDPTDDENEPVRPSTNNCCGRVLAHLDEVEFDKPDVAKVHQPLLDLNPKRAQPIRSLLDEFNQNRSDVGLVYVLCHGMIEGQSIGLGSETDGTQRITSTELMQLALPLLKYSKPIVFLNACNSVQAHQNRDYFFAESNVSNVDIFLGKGAIGVIGTLDAVSVLQASQTAEQFFSLIRQSQDKNVAETLRQLRSSIFSQKDAGKIPTDEQLRNWYHTFQYVFYGHPETKLNIEDGSAMSAATNGKEPQ